LEQVVRVARVPRPVLVRGERGTGKELVAAAIHQASPRADAPFITVNCAALSEGLLECELFGQEENAFHNAPFKLGRFELANHGTLFLDEIGNMSVEFQRKILRVIEYQQFQRVQGTETITVDVRLVAATNMPLEEAMQEGRFREDLYDRLAFETIPLPPLRERKEDLPLLAEHFLRLFAAEVPGITVKRVTPDAMQLLQGYHWPGNVRELKNVIERAAYRIDGDVITPAALPADLRSSPRAAPTGDGFIEKVEHFERTLLLEALEETHWNQKEAAERLGLKYDQLRHLYKKYRFGEDRP
jgi:DNA-binding NtrC family response regulator